MPGNTLREKLTLSLYVKKKDSHCVTTQVVFLCFQHLIDLCMSNWNTESKLIKKAIYKLTSSLNYAFKVKSYFVHIIGT